MANGNDDKKPAPEVGKIDLDELRTRVHQLEDELARTHTLLEQAIDQKKELQLLEEQKAFQEHIDKEDKKKAASLKSQAAKHKNVFGDMQIPEFFLKTRYADPEEEKKAYDEAVAFLIGSRGGTSFSAQITYVGSHRMISKQITLALETFAPQTNNWKLFTGSARFFKGQKNAVKIKDALFIKEALASKNYTVEWVKDERKSRKEVVKEVIAENELQRRTLPLRLRRDSLSLGVKFPVSPAEAKDILDEIKQEKFSFKEGLDEKVKSSIMDYLTEIVEHAPASVEEDAATAEE